MAMDLGPLLGLFLQSFIVQVTMSALAIIIFVIVYGRMIEIYLMVSLAPIPLSTFGNREQSKYRTELSAFAVCNRIPGIPDYDLRGHLCGADSGLSHSVMTSSVLSGVLWATPSFCASPCLRLVRLRRVYSALTKGRRKLFGQRIFPYLVT